MDIMCYFRDPFKYVSKHHGWNLPYSNPFGNAAAIKTHWGFDQISFGGLFGQETTVK